MKVMEPFLEELARRERMGKEMHKLFLAERKRLQTDKIRRAEWDSPVDDEALEHRMMNYGLEPWLKLLEIRAAVIELGNDG